MNSQDLKKRTKQFAIQVIKFVAELPNEKVSNVGHQLLRSGTSVGANYRAACRAKSPKDFISKMKIVEEEADESVYWTELFIESETNSSDLCKNIKAEANELTAIFTQTLKTIKAKAAQE